MDNSILFLCPICKGNAEMRHQKLRNFPVHHYVICTKCGLRTKDYDTIKDAVTFWNTRDGRYIPDDNWDD